MKVTYTQNRFEIDGVEIMNPEVLPNVYYKDNRIHIDGVDPGEDWDLPDNIIAEKGCNYDCCNTNGACEHCQKEVYRLKLKEPLVDTGSKERQEEILLDIFGNNIDQLLPPFPGVKKAMEEYSSQQLSEYKEKLKAEIEKQMVLFTKATYSDSVRNDYRREVLTLIDMK